MTWVAHDPDAGEMANILASHSLNKKAMDRHNALYRTIMFGDSGLSRIEREAIAVRVSAANDSHY